MGRQICVPRLKRVIIARCTLIPEVAAQMLSRVSQALAQISCFSSLLPPSLRRSPESGRRLELSDINKKSRLNSCMFCAAF